MAKSTGIVLAATGISFANEWYNTGDPNYRIGIAGLGVSLFMAGLETISETAAVGLSVMMMITVLATPFGGKAPFQTVLDLTEGK